MGTGWGTGGPQPQQIQRQPPRVRGLRRAPAKHPSPRRTPPEVSPVLRGPGDTHTYVLCSASPREWPWACRLLRGHSVSMGDRGGPKGPRGTPGHPPAVGVPEGVLHSLQVALLQARVVLAGQAQRQVQRGVGVPSGVPRQPQQPRTQSPHGARRALRRLCPGPGEVREHRRAENPPRHGPAAPQPPQSCVGPRWGPPTPTPAMHPTPSAPLRIP